MQASNVGALDVTSFARIWSPRLMRFYYLLCANQRFAESFTIETLVEIAKADRWKTPWAVARLGLAKATSITVSSATDDDRVACVVASMPRKQGCVIALVRGMGLSVAEVAEVTRVSISEARRVLAEALLELHRSLRTDSLNPKGTL
jgi:hypothetical protein